MGWEMGSHSITKATQAQRSPGTIISFKGEKKEWERKGHSSPVGSKGDAGLQHPGVRGRGRQVEMRDRIPVWPKPQRGAQVPKEPIGVTAPMKRFFQYKGILTVRSQGIPQTHSMQQTSHKIFMGEKNRMVVAFEEKRQQRAG